MERNRKKNSGASHLHKTMRKVKKTDSGESPLWLAVLWGTVIAVIVTMAGLAGGASLFYAGILAGTPGQYQWISILITIAALLSGMFWVFRSQQGKKKWWALAVAAAYFLLRLIFSGLLLSFA